MSEKTYIAIETLKRMEKFNEKEIVIKGETKEFNLFFNQKSIPHLLGIHYINENISSERGAKLMNRIINNNMSDQEILEKVQFHHGNLQKERVEKRINTFNDFINNLENGLIVEKNPERNIPIDYLIIRNKNGNFEHLGIVKTEVGDVLERFDDNRDEIALKTYIIQQNNLYFKGTKISEKIEYIKAYDEKINEFKYFSFDEEKQKYLDKFSNKNMKYEKIIDYYNRTLIKDKDYFVIQFVESGLSNIEKYRNKILTEDILKNIKEVAKEWENKSTYPLKIKIFKEKDQTYKGDYNLTFGKGYEYKKELDRLEKDFKIVKEKSENKEPTKKWNMKKDKELER